MPKLASSSKQVKLISPYRRPKKPPALDCPPCSGSSSHRISRRIHELRACSTARTVPSLGAKRTLHDPASGLSWIQIRSRRRKPESESKLGGDDLCCFSSQIPIWGAKRPRSALRSGQQIPIWGARRPRSAPISNRLLPVQPRWRDWTGLGDGPAGLIAECLLADDVADYMSFRAVCRPWRLCSTDPRVHGILDRRFHPHQWIMLRGTGRTPYRRRFMNVSTGHCRYVDLPELRGHDVFPTTEGLLVLLERTTYVVRLLNPFTRQAADLPPATALLSKSDMVRTDIRNLLLKVSGAGLANDSTIAVYFRGIKTLAIVKPGDVHWTVVDRGRWLLPATSFAGRFYCATTGAVMVVETSADHPPRLAVAAKLTRPLSMMMMDTVHLVNSEGELILVDRQRNGNNNRKYDVYRVDLDARATVPIRGLGGRAVFMGIELALSVSPSVFPSISADAIYLGFDRLLTGRLDNSPIHLMDGTAEPRQFEYRSNILLYGPRGVDDYLSWFVTGYRDYSEDT
uniref:KIB1-4 beta-propeller domain-containing protein n=1 Tax=Arundo donax TaxID=35708 RepID=A0A0A9DP70_ARUDO